MWVELIVGLFELVSCLLFFGVCLCLLVLGDLFCFWLFAA